MVSIGIGIGIIGIGTGIIGIISASIGASIGANKVRPVAGRPPAGGNEQKLEDLLPQRAPNAPNSISISISISIFTVQNLSQLNQPRVQPRLPEDNELPGRLRAEHRRWGPVPEPAAEALGGEGTLEVHPVRNKVVLELAELAVPVLDHERVGGGEAAGGYAY